MVQVQDGNSINAVKKRIIFCTYSSIYSTKVMKLLLSDNDIELVGVINSTRVLNPRYGHLRGALKQIKLSGVRYSSYLFVITDLYKFLKPVSLYAKFLSKDIHSLAKLNTIPVFDTKDVNNKESLDFIKSVKPDYLLCSHFNQLIKRQILDIETLQCINIHPSLLPEYRGVDPVFYAMIDGQETFGVTVHRMAETFDTGETLVQRAFDVDRNKTLFFNNCLLFQEGIKIALTWIKNNQKQLLQISTKNSGGSYDSWPTSIDVKKFKKAGDRLINISELWKLR